MREDLQNLVKQYGTAKLKGQKKDIEKSEIFLNKNEKVWYVCAGAMQVIKTGSGESFAKAPWMGGVYFFTDQRLIVVYTPARGDIKLLRSLPYTEMFLINFKPCGSLTDIMITAAKNSYNLSASSKHGDTEKVISSGLEEYALSHLSSEEIQAAWNILQLTDEYLEKKLHLNDAHDKISELFAQISILNQSSHNNKLYVNAMNITTRLNKKSKGEAIDDKEIVDYRNKLEAELNALPENLKNQSMTKAKEKNVVNLERQESVEESSSEDISFDEIRKYKSLLDDGIITENEFNAKKKQLLGL